MANETVTQNDAALNRLAQVVSTDWIVPAASSEVNDRWRAAFVAQRVADVLAQLCTDQRLCGLDVADRAWLREQAEQLVEDAQARFHVAPVAVPTLTVMEHFMRDVNEGRR